MSKKKKTTDAAAVLVQLDDTARSNLQFLHGTHRAPVKSPQIFREALAEKAERERAKKESEVAV